MNAQPQPNPDPQPPSATSDPRDPFASLTPEENRRRNLALVAFLKGLMEAPGDPAVDEANLRDWEHFRATEGL